MKKRAQKHNPRIGVALLLALVTLLTAGCGSGNKGGASTPSITNAPSPDGSLNPLDTIEVRDFGGRDFTLLTCVPNMVWDVEEESNMFENEIAGNPIAETEYKRSMAFEEKYNCELFASKIDASEFYNYLNDVKMNDSTDYDLLDPPTQSLASMLSAGFFHDLYSVNTIEHSAEWYNSLQMENYTTNGKLYLMASDITITGQTFFSLVYNREVLAKYQIEADMDTLVKSGKWTVDAFNDILTLTEFSGDNADNSQTYGLMFNAAPIGRWIWALGSSILEKTEDGSFVAGCTGKNMLPIAEALNKLLHSHGSTVHIEKFYNSGIPTSKLLASFKAGKALFITFDIGGQYYHLRDMDFAKGYAPLPKLTESQPDYYLNCATGLWGIPCSTTSFEESGLAFDFFARYSNVHLKPAFFEIILGGRLSEYPEDYEMLNFLHTKKTFDVGYSLDEKSEFIDSLYSTVVLNKAPNSISIYLATKTKSMNSMLAIANGIA